MSNTPNVSSIVLVVDDSPESLGMLNAALNNAGLTVLVALSGQQALSIAERITPDVILMDAMMPGMDGFETCEKIKQQLPMTPVIFMTGLTDVEHVVRGFEVGGVDYVTKPIVAEEVMARIKVHTQNARLAISAQTALDHAGQYVICVDHQGEIEWATPHVHQLVASAKGEEAEIWHSISAQLITWLQDDPALPLTISLFEMPMHAQFGGEHQAGHSLIRLVAAESEKSPETLQQKLPITKRESEVLYWVSFGKTNWEIAQILSMSPRTVNKHLEQLFKKIDVDNRTAAAAISIRILDGGEAQPA
ncbi:DNA-binding response regulator [Corallincola holothuriorum]|uniref:DNA-binding response regulator n=1 Tax=Corallincola holothuriorum TaxID=2282215 RepID=A0A368N6X1_9GAMM|nr:response regulator transcription factor [Corallincola holothuriorum]RCU45265.1 DNA-binding response regulator [Corallincola holothuriorum]